MVTQQSVYYLYQSYLKEKKHFLRNTDTPGAWVLLAVEEGQFDYHIEVAKGSASSGDIIICPPYTLFHRQIIKPLTFHYFVFNYVDKKSPHQAYMMDTLRHMFQFKCSPSEKDRLFNNFRHLFQLTLREDDNARAWKNHFLNDIWTMVGMQAEQNENRSVIGNDPLMKRAKTLIEQSAFEELLMKDLANNLQLHPVQFTRRFQAVHGMNPYQYLTSIRMEKAKSLLIHTDFTIDHIARTCGYNNGFYFSRIFTKYTKKNPSDYRRIHTLPSP